MLRICFTGHRPSKIGGYNVDNPITKQLFRNTVEVLYKLIKENDNITFYCGAAIGFDMYCQFICSYLKRDFPNKQIRIVMAIPFYKQYTKWNEIDQARHHLFKIHHCDEIVYVDSINGYTNNQVPIGDYHVSKLQVRNLYMVDNADLVLAYWDGVEQGGTWNAINYANKTNKKVINCWKK